MSRDHHRPRRPVSPRTVRLLKLIGFRYSTTRDAYVLRVVGRRFGPVYQIQAVPQQPDEPHIARRL